MGKRLDASCSCAIDLFSGRENSTSASGPDTMVAESQRSIRMCVRLYYRGDAFTSKEIPSVAPDPKRRGATSKNGWGDEIDYV